MVMQRAPQLFLPVLPGSDSFPLPKRNRPLSLCAKTHQVTIFIAPVYYLTETMMEDKLLGAARLQREPAASTTQVPTVNSKQNMMRFSSSSASLQEDSGTKSAMSPAADKSCIGDQDHRSSENMVKAALTEFLNDADVKSNPDGNKCIQNLLMKTEREWKEQRRLSVHQRAQE